MNTAQCEINQAEGIATLPANRNIPSIFRIVDTPIINPNSNGVSGNNQELGKALNNNIMMILDTNPDTWFEYERVLNTDDGISLTLDLTINMGSEKILNFIRVNPNNFGTRTQIAIDTIDTSIDGKVFVSVKDDIPIAGFTTEDEENVFTLAPTTSKYAGEGLYTFTPRRAKYVHITLRQTTPYLIDTPSGQKFRYAIGLRDIELHAVTYAPVGELVSTSIAPGDEIRKVLLQSNQNPSDVSELATIEHRISPDGGLTWHEIQPKEFSGSTVPEIIGFNGTNVDTIVTSKPVNTLLYKATLLRNSAAFKSGASSLRQVIKTTTELHAVPGTAPFKFELFNNPVSNSVQLIDPSFGSRGNEKVRYNVGAGFGDAVTFRLPWENIQRDFTKTLASGIYSKQFANPERIEIEGRLFSRVDDITTAGVNDESYELDYVNGVLKFGDSVNYGKAPTGAARIDLYFTPERLAPSSEPDLHISPLQFPTTGDKDSLTIKRYDLVKRVSMVLSKRATIHRLGQENIVEGSLQFSTNANSVFTTQQTFQNGSTELSDTGDWSVDLDNGIVYSQTETSSTENSSCDFIYQPITQLSDSNWDFVEGEDGLKTQVSIKDTGWSVATVSNETVSSGINIADMSEESIVPGTVIFTLPSGITAGNVDTDAPPVDPFRQEVVFIDGSTEFTNATEVAESLPASSAVVASKVTTQLSVLPVDSLQFPLYFSNTTLFATLVASTGAVTSTGDYYIGMTTGLITLYSTDEITSTDLGTVNYFYTDSTRELEGLYSINYGQGVIHTYSTIPIGTVALGSATMTYDYTHFEAIYNIARWIPQDKFDVDLTTKTVSIRDSEILTNQLTSTGEARYAAGKYYQVVYDFVESTRDAVRELEPFFTPVLKDYSLKILTKGRLF